jgi:cyclopropane fatty-acyl-phospholipid synthase-like methyltransferase
MQKPYSQACENNKQPILSKMSKHLSQAKSGLEIGSGTGQHAVYFGQKMPHINWQTSDRIENHQGIQQWLAESQLDNVKAPLEIDVEHFPPIEQAYDFIYSANTLHIMGWHQVILMFKHIPELLNPMGKVFIYGPFNYFGHYTSDSNRSFEQWLVEQDPNRGIRDIQDIIYLANSNQLSLISDWSMPANNRLLMFQLDAI